MGTRSTAIGRGLAPTESGVGTLISFSTQPGNVALDGEGRNSPFAKALVQELLTNREDLSAVLIQVRNAVMKQTANRQVPWEHSALTAKVYLSQPPAAEPVALQPVPHHELQTETALWNAVKDSSQPDVIQTYLDRYPSGIFAPLAGVRLNQMKSSPEPQQSLTGALDSSSDLNLITRELQRELKRVGCDPGVVDGKWSDKTEIALKSFAARTNLAIHVDRPSPDALTAVQQQRVRVCTTQASAQPSTRSTTTGKNCRQETRAECRTRLGLDPYGRGGGNGRCAGTRTICD